MKASPLFAFCVLTLAAACGDDGVKTDVSPATGDSCRCRLGSKFDNLAICVSPATTVAPAHVYSTNWDATTMKASCDPYRDPQPAPSAPWTGVQVSSACLGTGKLCITVKAGNFNAISPDDCVLASECANVDNQTPDAGVTLPPLPGWTASSATCAARQAQLGAYMELSLNSQTLGCDPGGDEIKRFPVCPALCQDNPNDPSCKVCSNSAVFTTL